MAGLESNKIKTGGRNAIHGKICIVEENKCTVNSAAMDTVATATSGHERQRRDADEAQSGGRSSSELGGDWRGISGL